MTSPERDKKILEMSEQIDKLNHLLSNEVIHNIRLLTKRLDLIQTLVFIILSGVLLSIGVAALKMFLE